MHNLKGINFRRGQVLCGLI